MGSSTPDPIEIPILCFCLRLFSSIQSLTNPLQNL